MTSEQVIKDLQSVMEWFEKHGRNTNTAVIGIAGRAVELIEAQKAEIEKLKTENKKMFNKWEILDNATKKYYADLYTDSIEAISSEAIKEFAEKAKQNFAAIRFDRTVSTRKTYRAEEVEAYTDGIFHQLIPNELDELVKEMTNENHS